MSVAGKITQLNQIKSEIKSAINAKGGTAGNDMTEYGDAILGLPEKNLYTLPTITSNGTYSALFGYDGFTSPITVNVQTPLYDQQTITSNGTYSAPEGYEGFNSPITVNVSPNLYSRSAITANGTYSAPSGYDGFASPITVSIPTYDGSVQ